VSDLRLREFQYPGDYPAVRKIWENAGPGIHLRRSDDPDEIEKKLLRDPDLFLVAEQDGELAGTVLGSFDGRRGMVYHLAVAEKFRRHGVGELLMDELERRLVAKGCIRCYLLVTVDNEIAQSFYKKNGWEHMEDLLSFGKDLE
jgi:ribosomal protein S18 acetylase RimI-like enzyme